MATEIYKPLLQTRTKFLGLGVDSVIGTVDKMTLLKYSKAQTPRDNIALTILDLEAQILTRIVSLVTWVREKTVFYSNVCVWHGSITQSLKDYTPIWQQGFA